MLNNTTFISTSQAVAESYFAVARKGFEGFEQLVGLNLQAARANLAEAGDAVQSALSAKDAAQLLALQSTLYKPVAEKLSSYARHVLNIASATGADMRRVAADAAANAQHEFMTALEAAFKNAPAGTENVTAFVKSAVANANSAFEGAQQAAAQVAAAAEANLQAVTESATKAIEAGIKNAEAKSV